MKNKKVWLVALAMVLVLFTSVSASNSSPPKLLLNGNPITVDAKVINNQVYVPLDSYTKAIGGNTTINTQGNTIEISLGNMDDIIPKVIEAVSPSVVGIIGTYDTGESKYGTFSEQQFVHGTGAIITANGEIITNAHVVGNMRKIIVVLADGNAYEAKLKAIDDASDLAIITINKTGLSPVKFAQENNLSIGNTVIAIGTPISFSLRNSASIGIISGINRSIDSEYKLIQTDAAINPGNSGGPLVNLAGEIVGINTSKYIGEGIEGMGFSVPVSTVKYVLGQFDKYSKVIRPYLGVKLAEDWISKLGLPSNSGIIIESIEDKSPASSQGLKPKDVLLSINDIKINSIVDYNEEMKKYEPSSKATFKIKRNGIIQNLAITFGQKK
jgi:serine protease Do